MSFQSTTRLEILKLLAVGKPMSASEIARALGKPSGTIASCINGTRKKKGLLRIVDWKQSIGTRGAMGAIYGLGPGRDAPKPPKLTHKEINANYRRRMHAVIRHKMQTRRGAKPINWLSVLL